jgi:hypothetical protein
MYSVLNKQKAVLNKQIHSLSEIKELVDENEKTYHMNVNATNAYSALVQKKLTEYSGSMGNVTSLTNSTEGEKKNAFVEESSSTFKNKLQRLKAKVN